MRYASWDLSTVYLVDERSGQLLCRLYPQDKTRNANAMRAPLEALASTQPSSNPPTNCTPAVPSATAQRAPLLEKLLRERAATGLPPAYLPKDERPPPDEGDDP